MCPRRHPSASVSMRRMAADGLGDLGFDAGWSALLGGRQRRAWLRVLAAGRACSGRGWRESCDSATVLGVGLAMGRGFIRPFRLGGCASRPSPSPRSSATAAGTKRRGATLVPVAFGRAHVRRNAVPPPNTPPRRAAPPRCVQFSVAKNVQFSIAIDTGTDGTEPSADSPQVDGTATLAYGGSPWFFGREDH